MTQPPEQAPESEEPVDDEAAAATAELVDDDPGDEDPDDEPTEVLPVDDEPARRSRWKVVVVVVVALLVLGGAATGLYFLTRGKDTVKAGSPDQVREEYIRAYEAKDFEPILREACRAYKDDFGTDSAKLEERLEPYDVSAKAWGPPELNGDTAIAYIDLELSRRGDVERPRIEIQVVKESGKWRFCGEEPA